MTTTKSKRERERNEKKRKEFSSCIFLFYEAAELVAACLAANICLA